MKALTTENIWGGVLTRVEEKPVVPIGITFKIPVEENGTITFKDVTDIPETTIVTREYITLRPILFEKTKRGCGKDLLFSCQKYPIYSRATDDDSKLIIRRSSNLSDLLLLMEYGRNMPREQAFEFLEKLSRIEFRDRIRALCGISRNADDDDYIFDESKAILGMNIIETINIMARVKNRTQNILPVIEEPGFDNIRMRK